ncbi:glycosyl transferase family 8 [Brenneria roseae subsp. americana]|uniref:Glycosyl transferase family 8 n=1 Tax=Brenneria roseae subsp. americana TaxID=1508507 RepID=A0A2U1TS83_9GAMM|nr:glycosyltransferase [Brenneria roseae]PWC12258.1 glycosyl transferase family 8 [Brenneria roseae subsp. americana]
MNNEEPIHIAYCTDANYLEYVATSIISIILNNLNNHIQFHIFLSDVEIEDYNKIKKINGNIKYYTLDGNELDKYNDNFSIKHLNRSIYLRLLVPRLLRSEVKKLIYLDADTLCFSDISEINDIDISNVVCAACSDSISEQDTRNSARLNLINSIYFNSGFLYINIDNWIKYDVEKKVNKLINSSEKKFLYPDQDALNIVLNENIVLINKKWNFLFNWMNDIQKENYFLDKKNLPHIIHFTGGRKPWFKEHTGLSQNLYIFYKHFTPWAQVPLKSYKNKMRSTDYRVYAKIEFKKGNYIKSFLFFVNYLQLKLKNKKTHQ